jgi:hypothetical protein
MPFFGWITHPNLRPYWPALLGMAVVLALLQGLGLGHVAITSTTEAHWLAQLATLGNLTPTVVPEVAPPAPQFFVLTKGLMAWVVATLSPHLPLGLSPLWLVRSLWVTGATCLLAASFAVGRVNLQWSQWPLALALVGLAVSPFWGGVARWVGWPLPLLTVVAVTLAALVSLTQTTPSTSKPLGLVRGRQAASTAIATSAVKLQTLLWGCLLGVAAHEVGTLGLLALTLALVIEAGKLLLAKLKQQRTVGQPSLLWGLVIALTVALLLTQVTLSLGWRDTFWTSLPSNAVLAQATQASTPLKSWLLALSALFPWWMLPLLWVGQHLSTLIALRPRHSGSWRKALSGWLHPKAVALLLGGMTLALLQPVIAAMLGCMAATLAGLVAWGMLPVVSANANKGVLGNVVKHHVLRYGTGMTWVSLCLATLALAGWLFMGLPSTLTQFQSWWLPGSAQFVVPLNELLSDKLSPLTLAFWRWWLILVPLWWLVGVVGIAVAWCQGVRQHMLWASLCTWALGWQVLCHTVVQPIVWPAPQVPATSQSIIGLLPSSPEAKHQARWLAWYGWPIQWVGSPQAPAFTQANAKLVSEAWAYAPEQAPWRQAQTASGHGLVGQWQSGRLPRRSRTVLRWLGWPMGLQANTLAPWQVWGTAQPKGD